MNDDLEQVSVPEQWTEPAPIAEPKPKRKYVRRKKWNAKRKKAAVSSKVETVGSTPARLPPIDCVGMTSGLNGSCAIACGPNCIITGNICAHPHKGGLQYTHQQDNEILARFQEARRYLHRIDAENNQK